MTDDPHPHKEHEHSHPHPATTPSFLRAFGQIFPITGVITAILVLIKFMLASPADRPDLHQIATDYAAVFLIALLINSLAIMWTIRRAHNTTDKITGNRTTR